MAIHVINLTPTIALNAEVLDNNWFSKNEGMII